LRRENQELERLIAALSPIESKWRDAYADQVIAMIQRSPQKAEYAADDLIVLLDDGFKLASTVMQLVLDLSKDEYKKYWGNYKDLHHQHGRRIRGGSPAAQV
jgi:predicted transcriptional regulator